MTPKAASAAGVIFAAIVARVLGRVFSPAFYPWLLGLLQLGLVIELGRFWPWWLPVAGGGALLVLLTTLAVVAGRWRLKGLLLFCVIGLLTIAPTIAAIATRARVGITSMDQDSSIQTELAVDRFLHGLPIYASDWSTTVLAKMPWPASLGASNPALHHYVYFPLTFLSAAPVRLLAQVVGLAFDYRMVVLIFVGVGLFAAWFLPISAPDRFAVAVALFLNPLTTLFLWSGRNDLCFASLVVLAIGLLGRGRTVWASLTLGFASAFKLFAAPAIPVLLALLWLRYRRRRNPRELILGLLAVAAFPLLTIVPFLAQAPGAFVRDVVLYPGGGLPDSYPIAGFGLGGILLFLHLVHRSDYFPFVVFQAIGMALAGWFGLSRLLARPTLRRWMFAYLGLFLALGFFGRYFNDSHIGIFLALALCCRPLGDRLLAPIAAEETIRQAA